jgi:hypothetical protein
MVGCITDWNSAQSLGFGVLLVPRNRDMCVSKRAFKFYFIMHGLDPGHVEGMVTWVSMVLGMRCSSRLSTYLLHVFMGIYSPLKSKNLICLTLEFGHGTTI